MWGVNNVPGRQAPLYPLRTRVGMVIEGFDPVELGPKPTNLLSLWDAAGLLVRAAALDPWTKFPGMSEV